MKWNPRCQFDFEKYRAVEVMQMSRTYLDWWPFFSSDNSVPELTDCIKSKGSCLRRRMQFSNCTLIAILMVKYAYNELPLTQWPLQNIPANTHKMWCDSPRFMVMYIQFGVICRKTFGEPSESTFQQQIALQRMWPSPAPTLRCVS